MEPVDWPAAVFPLTSCWERRLRKPVRPPAHRCCPSFASNATTNSVPTAPRSRSGGGALVGNGRFSLVDTAATGCKAPNQTRKFVAPCQFVAQLNPFSHRGKSEPVEWPAAVFPLTSCWERGLRKPVRPPEHWCCPSFASNATINSVPTVPHSSSGAFAVAIVHVFSRRVSGRTQLELAGETEWTPTPILAGAIALNRSRRSRSAAQAPFDRLVVALTVSATSWTPQSTPRCDCVGNVLDTAVDSSL